MEEKTKLYVFEKKEVALIFLFMLLIALTSFIMGIKIGKNYSYKVAGLTTDDRQKVELLSTEEEMVDQVVTEKKVQGEGSTSDAQLKDLAFQKLKEKIDKEFTQPAPEAQPGPAEKTAEPEAAPVPAAKAQASEAKAAAPQEEETQTPKDQYSGKYTIQLGSHRALADAEKFADGFRIRGYNPIITEVRIKERGTWYRVSLGVFGNITEAKDYIVKEKTLFEGVDYVIGRFD